MTVTLDKLRAAAQMDDSAFQSAPAALSAMTPSQRRENETMEGYTIRVIREDERERCAKIAEAHKGSAARKRREAGRTLHLGSEYYAEIVSEERGEDIAAEMIAAAIRKEACLSGWHPHPLTVDAGRTVS